MLRGMKNAPSEGAFKAGFFPRSVEEEVRALDRYVLIEMVHTKGGKESAECV